jgi:hypothetical protein
MVALQGMRISDAALRLIIGPHGFEWTCTMREEAEEWSCIWHIVELLRGVKNLAFWPKGGEKFARHIETLEKDIKTLGVPEATADLWRSHTRIWFKEGIRGKE